MAFVVGEGGQEVNKYNLSEDWNITSSTFDGPPLDISGVDSAPSGIFFKEDGKKMYITGWGIDYVHEFNLSLAWNISSALYLQNFSVASQDNLPSGIFIKPDGLKMYISGGGANSIHEYDLSEAWNVSSASYLQNFSVASRETFVMSVFFNATGNKMYMIGTSNDSVHEFDLSEDWNVTSAIWNQANSLAPYPTIQGLFFKSEGDKMYVVGAGGGADDVYEFDLKDITPPNTTINQPLNQTYTTKTIIFNVTALDDYTISDCNYTLTNGVTNYTMANITTSPTQWIATNVTMNEGGHKVFYHCWDISGNLNNSENVSFYIDSIPPNINITFPINNTSHKDYNLDVNYSRSDVGLESCWYSNDTYLVNKSLAGCGNLTTIVWSEGRHNVTIWANDSLGHENYSRVSFTIAISPNISIITPNNNTNWSDVNLDINYSRSDVTLESCWYSNDTYLKNTTLAGCTNLTTIVWSEGKHNVTIWANDSLGNENSSSVGFTIDTTAPTIIDATNITNLTTLLTSINSTWQFNATDPNLRTCFYNTTDNPSIRMVTCNSTITGTNWTTSGNKMIYYYANDSAGNEAYKNKSLIVRLYSYLQATNKTYITEGKEAYFNLTLDVFSIPVTATATLWHNYTAYSPTTIQVGANQSNFSVTITIPDEIGTTTGANATWFWEYDLTGLTKANTSLVNQTVYSLGIDNCSTYAVEIVNLSLMDEETNVVINSSLINSTIEVDITLTSGAILESYSTTFTNMSGARICIPSGLLDDNATEYLMDIVVRYVSYNYVEEFYYIDDEPISNTTVPEYIYLRNLLVADSQSFVVSFSGDEGLLVEDAIIYLLRKYIGDGIFRVVEAGKTDDDGETVLHFVEEDVIYMFNVTKNGAVLWTSPDYRVYCAVAPCELELSSDGEVPDFPSDWDQLPTGSYSVSSNQSTRIITLSFNLNETAEMNLTVYEYSQNATIMSTPIDSEVLTASSGSIDVYVPFAYGNATFYSVIYKDDVFVGSHWSKLKESPSDYFDNWVLVLVGLIILSLGLMAISTGVGMVVYALLGIVMATILNIFEISYAVLIFIIVAGIILIWKVITRRGD